MQKRTIKLSAKRITSHKYTIKTITKSPIKTIRKKKSVKNTKFHDIKPNQKMIFTQTELDDGKSLASVEDMAYATKAAYASAVSAKESIRHIRTGIVYSKNGVKKIATAVKHESISKNLSSGIKAGGKLVGKGVTKAAIASAAGVKDSVLRMQIDNSKVTDTGIESLKQGISYIRYASNTKKAVSNTIKTSAHTIKNIRNAPQNIRKTVNNVKRSANIVKNTAKATGKIVAKLATSKVFWILLIAVVGILIFQMLATSFISSASGVIGGIFGWLDDDKDEKDLLNDYINIVSEYTHDQQDKIDDIYYDFEPDKQEYEPYSPIWEFRDSRFKYDQIRINEREVIALVAAKWYTDELSSDDPPDDLKLKKQELKKMVDNFFDFEYHYEYDYCPHSGCCHFDQIMVGGDIDSGSVYISDAWYCDLYYHGCKRIFKWITKDADGNWDFENPVDGDRNFCDNPNHQYLAGKVEYYSADTVMNNLGFSADEREWYQTYLDTINEILS